MCNERYYARGEDYFDRGLVFMLTEHKGQISARVSGTEDYRVKLELDDGVADYECSCPIGLRAEFCKHCVAVALTWIDMRKPGGSGDPAVSPKKKASPPGATPLDLRAWLMQQDKEILADRLLDAADKHEHIHNRLMLSAAVGDGVDLAIFKKILSRAIGRSKFIDYYHMPDYFHRVDNALDHLEDLLGQGHAAAVIDLSEWALVRVERAIERVDDSDGYMSDLLNRLQDFHLAACQVARPNPQRLAQRLFDWELNGDWDTFYKAVRTYAQVLGDDGVQRYRELAEAEWENIPPLKAGDEDPDRWGRRFSITRSMETLAELDGDFEALVRVKQRDLSSSYQYFDIVQTLLQASQEDRALQWAEKGQKVFGDKTDRRLLELTADLYHRFGRHDEAMTIIWSLFEHYPCLATFQNLKSHADHSKSWPDWRQRALTRLRKAYARETRHSGRAQPSSPRQAFAAYTNLQDHSVLVEIFMWEGDIDTAWREANAGGCRVGIWLQLARRRENQHPADAIGVYKQHIGPIVGRTNNEAYKEAVELIRRIHKLMKASDDEVEFRQYLTSLRTQFKRKRNFIKMLAAFD